MKNENGQIQDVESPLGKIIEEGAYVLAIGIGLLILGYVIAIIAVVIRAI